jgi:hypothetical protein
MTLKRIFAAALAVVMLGSCNKKLDELLVNPNGPTPASANSDLYLPVVQSSFVGVFNSASSFGMELTRMVVMYGPTYNQAYSPNSFDGVWNTTYTGLFKHANTLIPVATANKQYVQAGMAKLMKAYSMMTLVDMFGDVPYTQANLGIDNTNPGVDKGADVYGAAIKLLQEVADTLDRVAAGTLAHGAYPGFTDNFYGASNAAGARRWATQAKLLLIRAYMTTRRVDSGAKGKIEALLADPFVAASSTAAQDFEFKYSTKQANPNSRHPRYNSNYAPTGSASDYIGTHLMWAMGIDKGSFSNNEALNRSDPRMRYYFYRQRTNYGAVTSQTVSCSVAPVPAQFPAWMPFCLIGVAGYWGRDHGDNSGIPPDGNLRTTWGLYPAGGDFDVNQGTSVSLNRGGQGAGIMPIWQSAYTQFMLAEAVLSMGVAGNARTFLENGVRQSISKVVGFPATLGLAVDPAFVPTTTKITDYVTKVLTRYDAATTNEDRLNVVMNEWYIALWGNGADAHNNYRRTGYPNNFQLAKLPAPGPYIRSYLYPSNFINLNKNAPAQQAIDKKVFWDTNPTVLK